MDYVIIVAGGKGLRMGGNTPKQFLPIGGQPVLMHTIQRFHSYSKELNIILVLPPEHITYWQQLCTQHHFAIPHKVVGSGVTRFESSLNGLGAIPDSDGGLVAFHDGVRPFVSADTISRCFDKARKEFACIPVLPVTDTLRLVEADGNAKNVLRSDYRIVQTPQVFHISIAKQAFRQPYQEAFTDDASVIEHMGYTVKMVEGNKENIKLTTPYDLRIADFLLHQPAF